MTALKSEVTGRMDTMEGVLQDVVAELNATHEDVRYVRTTVTTLARSDAVQEAAIESLRKRLERVERKVGITQ
jgi:tetrahydromethanopterin S-methyltransferase subunit G